MLLHVRGSVEPSRRPGRAARSPRASSTGRRGRFVQRGVDRWFMRKGSIRVRRSRIALLVAAFAGIAAIAAGTVYAITIEVPARGTFATNKDQVELARGVARLIGQPTDAAVQKILVNPGDSPRPRGAAARQRRPGPRYAGRNDPRDARGSLPMRRHGARAVLRRRLRCQRSSPAGHERGSRTPSGSPLRSGLGRSRRKRARSRWPSSGAGAGVGSDDTTFGRDRHGRRPGT